MVSTAIRKDTGAARGLLVEHVIQQQCDQGYLVYPVVFLYWHHIELAPKNILLTHAVLIDRPFTETEKQHLGRHRSDVLWQDFETQALGRV